MVTCHIDAAIPENRSVTERIARRAQNEIGTALYRAYLQLLIPEVRAMRAEIDAEPEGFPDLLACSAAMLRGVLGEALGDLPDWAKPLTFGGYFGIRHRRFRDQLGEMLRDADDRGVINRRAGELTIGFGGDTNQAAQFARSVPDCAHAPVPGPRVQESSPSVVTAPMPAQNRRGSSVNGCMPRTVMPPDAG